VKYASGIIVVSAAVGAYYLSRQNSAILGTTLTSMETKTRPSINTETITGSTTSKVLSTDSPHEGTMPKKTGSVIIGDLAYKFNPTHVETVRPDLFNSGFFSMFDVVVHLDKQDMIDLEYHFDDSMNTHLIDSINGEANWWYEAYYSGGWREKNVFRSDHYPWKDETTLRVFKASPSHLENIYSIFKNEEIRRNNNGGRLVIPRVIIESRNFREEFKDVEVTPHNMRYDIFRENVTTALDAIMSLADQGEITYELKWYESIGTASIVNSYWVEAINEDKAQGRCGFVYEAGSPKYGFFQGNHIHLPSDVRVLNSPEYLEFFWICI
jgi:hypothetical protein